MRRAGCFAKCAMRQSWRANLIHRLKSPGDLLKRKAWWQVENKIVHKCKLAVHGRAIGLGLSAREIKRLMEALSVVSEEIANERNRRTDRR